jgi:hypothetical protein
VHFEVIIAYKEEAENYTAFYLLPPQFPFILEQFARVIQRPVPWNFISKLHVLEVKEFENHCPVPLELSQKSQTSMHRSVNISSLFCLLSFT